MIEAVGTRLIVEKVEANNITSSGIVLSAPNSVPRGVVVSVGAEAASKVDCPKIGDQVIVDWSRNSYYKIDDQGKEYFVVDITGVYAVERLVQNTDSNPNITI